MKLLIWAHKKLLPSTALRSTQHNADHLNGVSRSEWTSAGERGGSNHAEVLTIGTLGMCNLFSREEEEQGAEEVGAVEEEGGHTMSQAMADLASLNPQSLSSIRAPTSSNRAAVSSNRQSVSPVDIRKLQDELQKILYSKLGHDEHEGGGQESKKAKAKKQKRQRNAEGCYNQYIQLSHANGKLHVPNSERGSMRELTLPHHNFLEMPIDHIHYTSSSARPPYYKFLYSTQYVLLMQSLKNTFLHYTSPTRVKFSTSLFEKLVKPKINKDLHHGSSMDKMLHLLRKRLNKRLFRRSKNCQEVVVEEEEEKRLNWALAKSARENDKFISYIASIMEHTETNTKFFINEEYTSCYPHQPTTREEGSRPQLVLPTSRSLRNECWIETDNEYLVLEL